MINMHIRFVTELTKRILVHMKENSYGRILNIGSTGSFIPSPTDAVYSATKAYLMSFSNALFGELGKTGIKVTTLCPGATETEFAIKANIQNTYRLEILDRTIDGIRKNMVRMQCSVPVLWRAVCHIWEAAWIKNAGPG